MPPDEPRQMGIIQTPHSTVPTLTADEMASTTSIRLTQPPPRSGRKSIGITAITPLRSGTKLTPLGCVRTDVPPSLTTGRLTSQPPSIKRLLANRASHVEGPGLHTVTMEIMASPELTRSVRRTIKGGLNTETRHLPETTAGRLTPRPPNPPRRKTSVRDTKPIGRLPLTLVSTVTLLMTIISHTPRSPLRETPHKPPLIWTSTPLRPLLGRNTARGLRLPRPLRYIEIALMRLRT